MHADAAHAIAVLSENGRHFLRSTLDEVRKDNSAGNRNAVIFVAAALEVLLKTRLTIEHWTLLFDDPARAKLSDLKSGDLVSVQASKLVDRLNNVASLAIKPDAAKRVFQLRNRVVHFGPPTNFAVRVEVAIGLNFALEFIHDHVLPHLEGKEQSELAELKERISQVFLELDEFRIKRLLVLEAELKAHGTVVECPDCNQETLTIEDDGEEDTCLFCLATDCATQRTLGWAWRLPRCPANLPSDCLSSGFSGCLVMHDVRPATGAHGVLIGNLEFATSVAPAYVFVLVNRAASETSMSDIGAIDNLDASYEGIRLAIEALVDGVFSSIGFVPPTPAQYVGCVPLSQLFASGRRQAKETSILLSVRGSADQGGLLLGNS